MSFYSSNSAKDGVCAMKAETQLITETILLYLESHQHCSTAIFLEPELMTDFLNQLIV